jgi:hypothetical protein
MDSIDQRLGQLNLLKQSVPVISINDIPDSAHRSLVDFYTITELWSVSRTSRYLYKLLNELIHTTMKSRVYRTVGNISSMYLMYNKLLPKRIGEVIGIEGSKVWKIFMGLDINTSHLDCSCTCTEEFEQRMSDDPTQHIWIRSRRILDDNGELIYPRYLHHAYCLSHRILQVIIQTHQVNSPEEENEVLNSVVLPRTNTIFYAQHYHDPDYQNTIEMCMINDDYTYIPEPYDTVFKYVRHEGESEEAYSKRTSYWLPLELV